MTKCPLTRDVHLREVSVSGGLTVMPVLSLDWGMGNKYFSCL